jgi:hypothetical protein
MVDGACAECGRSLDSHDRHVRFTQPDPVLAIGNVDPSLVWMTDDTAWSSVLMQVQGVGVFVRALLVIDLTGDHRLTYGVWVGINPQELRRILEIWWEPAYQQLRLDGFLANAIPPWGLLGAPVTVEVVDPEQLPYCVASTHSELEAVLTGRFDHERVLKFVPDSS